MQWEEGLAACLWLLHPFLQDNILSPSQGPDTILCHWLITATVYWALTPHPSPGHIHFPLSVWHHHGSHPVSHRGKLRSSTLCKVTHIMCTWRADCLALRTKRETLGMGTDGYGKDSCQMAHGDRRAKGTQGCWPLQGYLGATFLYCLVTSL